MKLKRLWLAAMFAAVMAVIIAPEAWGASLHLEMGTYQVRTDNANRINNGSVKLSTGSTSTSGSYETSFYYLKGMEDHVNSVAIGLRAAPFGDYAGVVKGDTWRASVNGVQLTVEDAVISSSGGTMGDTSGFIISIPKSVLGKLTSEVVVLLEQIRSGNKVTDRELVVHPHPITFSNTTNGFSEIGEEIIVNFYKKAEKSEFDMQIANFDLAGSEVLKSDPLADIKIGLMVDGKISDTEQDLAGQTINGSGTEGILVSYDVVTKSLKLSAKDGAHGFGQPGTFTLAVWSSVRPEIKEPTASGASTATKPATVAGIPEGGTGKFIFKKIKITVHPAEEEPPSKESEGKVESAIDNAIGEIAKEIEKDPDSERAKDLQEMLDRIISDDKTPNYIVFGGGDEKGESTFEFVNGYPDYFRRGIDVQDQDKKDTEFTFVVLKPGDSGPVVNTTFAGPINVEIWYETELTNGDEGSWIMMDPFTVPFDDGVGRFTFSAAKLIEIVKERYPDYFETRNSFTGHVRMTCDVWPKTDKGQPEGVREFYFKIIDSSVKLPSRGGGSCAAGASAAALILAAALIARRKRGR